MGAILSLVLAVLASLWLMPTSAAMGVGARAAETLPASVSGVGQTAGDYVYDAASNKRASTPGAGHDNDAPRALDGGSAVASAGVLSAAPVVSVAADTGIMDLPAFTTWGRADSLTDHFVRHGGDFGATSEAEYAQEASGFFQRGLQDGLPTKINPKDGSIRIYDPQSNTFDAYNANGTTRTFYQPDPAQHGYPTHWGYWVSQPGYAP